MLSIILINYNSSKLLIDCIKSIYQETSTTIIEIIVVDNSADAIGKEIVLNHFPQIIWTDMGYNGGFARANNKGIEFAKGDIVLLLNPDTLIIDKAIDNVYIQFKESQYVACGVQLLNDDGTPQISGNYAMKGGLNYLLPLPYIGNFLKWLGEKIKVKKPNVPNATTIVEVDWINGAFLMFKKNIIQLSGKLDEDFFLYAEEAEWCSRIKQYGKLCIYGDQKIIHLQGESSNEAFNSEGKGYYNLYDKKGLQIMVSNFLRIRKEFGLFWFLINLFFYTIEIPLYFIIGFIENIIKSKSLLNHWKNVKMYFINVSKLWMYVPKIIANNPYFYKIL